MARNIKIIAVGNPLRGDDGVGPAVLEMLRGMELPDNVGLVNAGCDPLDAIGHIMDADKAVIIDAAGMNRAPGFIALLRPENLRAVSNSTPCSTHIYGLAEGIELALAVGFKPEIRIIGIQPENTGAAEGLSAAVASSIPDVIKLVMEEVAS
ncbi:MAG: hydrogenase maturation protease [bacterium]